MIKTNFRLNTFQTFEKKNNTLHQLIHENIYPTGSAPAKICNLPKILNLFLPTFFLNYDLLFLLKALIITS